MEYRCSVLGCLQTSSDSVQLHKFPFDNQLLLPIWIMATNRSNWLPDVKSRMCEHHFSIDDYVNGDKKNKLKSNACPMFNTSNNVGEFDETMTNSDADNISSASEEYFSHINADDLDFSPKTCDLKYSDDDWIQYSSSDESLNDVLTFSSDTELNVDNKDVELDRVSLSSAVSSVENCAINKCAVVLCNENARNQFETLFFIDFPKNNKELCDTWWKICGRNDEFNFSFKICSIHFDLDDFTIHNIRRDGQLIKQTILKNNNIVPTRYLLAHEYTKFTRKRQKKLIKDKIEKCSVQNCNNSNNVSSIDGKKTFTRFPLENKHVLQKLLNNIGLPDWQPLKTDRICSDHLKNDFIVDNGNILELNEYVVPSITSKNLLDNNSEDHQTVKYKNSTSNVLHNSLNDKLSMVREKRKRKNEDNDNVLLHNLFDNNTKSQQQKSLETTSEKIAIKDNKNRSEFTLNKTKNHFMGSSVNISNDTTDDHMTLAKCTSKVIEIPQNMLEENNVIPKSKNNGNDRDFVYLDALSGDDIGEFLAFEKKCSSKHLKNKIPELLGKSQIRETPESIIYNQDLTECYGEMLPPNCDQNCQYVCYYSIPNHLRREIYKEFQLLRNITEQNCIITQLVQFNMIEKEDCSFESCPFYHLIMNKESIRVCRKFFMNTLGITEQRLNAILKPINYSWYSDKDTALKANQPKQVKVVNESTVMTDFMKESLIPLDKDYNAYEPESDSEVSLENVPVEEYERVFLYMKGIPRVLSSYQMPGEVKKQFFETSINLEYMYKTYSENFLKKKISPPYTKRQFKKIYNQYMKTFLKMV